MSTSQIRNFFGEVRRIQMKGGYDEENKASILLLRPKLAYNVARVLENNKNSSIQEFKKHVNHALELITDNKQFNNFIHLLECILAYHKANGGKNN